MHGIRLGRFGWQRWWRGLAERHGLLRHPVSIARRRLGTAVLLLLGTGAAAYSINTRDAAIRQGAIDFLSRATGGDVSVQRARFAMFDGITLHDVRIAVPFDPELDPTARTADEREIFSARSLRLNHNPWHLLFGRLTVREIIATRPKITLVYNSETGKRNWQLLHNARDAAEPPDAGARPMIRIRHAQVNSVNVGPEGRRGRSIDRLDADGRPQPETATGYCIEVRRLSEPAERTTVIFDPGARVVINSPFVDAALVRLQLPRTAQQFFDRIGLQGEVKLNRFVYEVDASQERDTEIILRRVRCGVPMSLLGDGGLGADAAGSAMSSALEMSDVEGIVNLSGDRLSVDISGRINGAKCRVTGHFADTTAGFEDAPFDLTLNGRAVPAPEGTLREYLVKADRVPETLQAILRDYDPHGAFDVDLHAVRIARGASTEITGSFSPGGARGRCVWFPYALKDLFGRVVMEPGFVGVEHLVGRHGSGRVRVDADIDRSRLWARIGVDIDGQGVELDERLRAALSDPYRDLWRRFQPRGFANITAHLRRNGSDSLTDVPVWTTQVTADLVDAAILYQGYPLPLEDVTGRLVMVDDRIDVLDLVGHRGDGAVRLNGFAATNDAGVREADFHIDAQSIALDDCFASALPPEGRGALGQFQPRGLVDLNGAIAVTGDGEIHYDLEAIVRDAAIRYRGFPYPIEDVNGCVRLHPDGFSIVSIAGRHGDAALSARGEVHRRDGGYEADLSLRGQRVALDDALYRACPAGLKRVWEMIRPAGTVDVATSLHYSADHGGPEEAPRHRTEIRSHGAAARFRAAPLPLSDIDSRVIITDRRIDIRSLTARSGQGAVRLAGTIDYSEAGLRGALNIDAAGLQFDEPVLRALPAGLRDAIASTTPGGGFDASFHPLRFEIDPDGRSRWEVTGTIRLRDASFDLGIKLTHLDGPVTGRLVVNRHGRVILKAETALGKATLADWQVEDLRADISAVPGSHKVLVQGAVARAYGGEASGTAEIRFDHAVDWQTSIVARDLQLSRVLKPGSDRAARGLLHGNIVLQGRSGPGGYIEGAGELFIRGAQVWKLPLMFAIFQVLNLTPDENVFHDGWLRYFLSGNTITFQKIDLQGKALSFVGGGRMDLNSKQMDITLLAGSPLRFRLPLLTDIVEGASRELMEVRVTGTPAKPNITPQPLKSLTRALETIFPDAPRKQGSRSVSLNDSPSAEP